MNPLVDLPVRQQFYGEAYKIPDKDMFARLLYHDFYKMQGFSKNFSVKLTHIKKVREKPVYRSADQNIESEHERNPAANSIVPTLECLPSDISGISSSTTT